MTTAGRSKATIYSRVDDFKNEGLYVFDSKAKIMMYSNCNCRVSWERKSVIDNHCQSVSHKANKTKRLNTDGSQKRQASVSDTFEKSKKTKDDREDFAKSTVSAFLKANIPLSKLDDENIKEWMKKYVKGT